MLFFSRNLRFVCKRFGLTQQMLAGFMKKTQTTIGNWQNGKSQPSLEELILLANYFLVDLSTFVAVDLEKENLIGETEIEKFNTRGQKKNSYKENLVKGNPVKYDYGLPETQVSEEDKTTNWVLLNELRNLSQKMDRLSASIDKMSKIKAK